MHAGDRDLPDHDRPRGCGSFAIAGRCPPRAPPPSASVSTRLTRIACSAGSRPHTMLVTIDNAAAAATTRASMSARRPAAGSRSAECSVAQRWPAIAQAKPGRAAGEPDHARSPRAAVAVSRPAPCADRRARGEFPPPGRRARQLRGWPRWPSPSRAAAAPRPSSTTIAGLTSAISASRAGAHRDVDRTVRAEERHADHAGARRRPRRGPCLLRRLRQSSHPAAAAPSQRKSTR